MITDRDTTYRFDLWSTTGDRGRHRPGRARVGRRDRPGRARRRRARLLALPPRLRDLGADARAGTGSRRCSPTWSGRPWTPPRRAAGSSTPRSAPSYAGSATTAASSCCRPTVPRSAWSTTCRAGARCSLYGDKLELPGRHAARPRRDGEGPRGRPRPHAVPPTPSAWACSWSSAATSPPRAPGPTGGWQVLVQDTADDPAGQVTLQPGWAVATSSTVRRAWRRGGVRLHHIVDPRTAAPAAPVWRSATVAAPTCAEANTASTAAVILGHDAGRWLSERGYTARLVDQRHRVVRVGDWPREVAA